MDLLGYQGKELFAKHGVPVPEGRPATTVPEATRAAEDLGFPVVVVRLDGTNDKEGRAARRGQPAERTTEATMLGAAEKVVELAG